MFSSRFGVSLFLALALILSACTADVEQQPAFKKMQQKLAEMEEAMGKNQEKLDTLFLDVGYFTEDMKALKKDLQKMASAEDQTGGTQMESLNARLQKMEESLARLGKQLGQTTEAQKKTADQAAAALKTAESAKNLAEKAAKQKSPSPTAAAPAASAKKSTKPASAQEKPKGYYYTVQKGDTILKVAQKHNLTSAELLRANHMPMDATLYAGQKIYVPASKP